MRRQLLRFSQIAIDLAALTGAFTLAFLLRFDGTPPASMVGRLFLTAPYVVLGEYLVLVVFGVHRFSWRYVGLREARRILFATVAATSALVGVRLVLGRLQHQYGYLRHGVLPFGVIAANFALAFLAVTGVRVLRRILGEHRELGTRARGEEVPTMLVGAGQAGVLVAREIARRPDMGILPVGFLDDDQVKLGTIVEGIAVRGTTADLADLCVKHRARQVLICMASASGKDIRRITRLAEEAGMPAKIIPGLYEILGGGLNLSRIRNVAIEDLLRREPVELDREAIRGVVHDRVVLVTGAGGSIGSELCRQACQFGPARLVLVERAETALFHIHRELLARYPDVPVEPCIADITDAVRMEELFTTYRPAAVLHAAAHKHVPMMEWNPCEAVKNNVFGTRLVADLAHTHGVETFVMISTDKAVNPTSVMGATKRAAELYVQALSVKSHTRFVTVRFGNVLGSAGSVIPIFKEQIERGGPITVTHPDMVRYFMTIPEACQLVLQAGSMGEGGEIFILDMGEPVHIVDLARDLIQLSGLKPGEDIDIDFTGCRPGEKLFEELSTDAEHADKTRHPKIFVGRTERHPWARVAEGLDALDAATSEPDRARAALRAMVPEFVPPEDRTDSSVARPSRRPSPRDAIATPSGAFPVVQTSGGAE